MKTTKLAFIISFLFLCSTASFAQIKEDRKVSDFNKISAGTGIQVEYTQGKEYNVTVEAKEQDIIDKVITDVKDNKLNISIKKTSILGFRSIGGITVYVTCPELNSVSASSGSKFSTERLSSSDDLKVSASSGSSCHLKNIEVSKTLSISTGSGSSIDANKVVAQNAIVKTGSGSSCTITEAEIKDSLNVSSGSGASATIKGKAENATLKASSGGSINARNLIAKNKNVSKSSGGSVNE